MNIFTVEISSATDETAEFPRLISKFASDSVIDFTSFLNSTIEYFNCAVQYGDETRIVMLVGTYGFHQVVTISQDPVTGIVTVA